MDIKPLPKRIIKRAKELGINEIVLRFSGGNDEGYLNIDTDGDNDIEFDTMVEEWAWGAYSYNGAGDGSDYGDDITYDLKNGKASCSEWYTARQDGPTETMDLEEAEDEEE